MALTPDQRKKAHLRGLALKAEREALKAQGPNRKFFAAEFNRDYERCIQMGLSHEESFEQAQKLQAENTKQQQQSVSKPEKFVGPRGGRYTKGQTDEGRPYRRYY